MILNNRNYTTLFLNIKQQFRDFFLISIGVFSAAFGLKGFLLANNFIDGGATGISLLITELTSIPLSLLIVLVNIPFILLAYRVIGGSFAFKSLLSILFLSLVLKFIKFPIITDDNLLVAVFGGFFLGAGIGFSIRGNAVLDGTEVLAIFLSRKLGSSIGDIVIIINVFVFGAAAYFLSIETALYSMVTYLAASKTLDFIVIGIEEYIGVTIITRFSNEVKNLIVHQLGHGVTSYSDVEGIGRSGEVKSMQTIYTVITRLEMNKLKTEIEMIDPDAFIVIANVREIKGGRVRKRPLQH